MLIAKNVSVSLQSFDDLDGIEIVASGAVDLSELFDPRTIAASSELRTAISAGDIILNDGVSDLTLAQSLDLQETPEGLEVLSSATMVGSRKIVNFIPGTGVGLTVADDDPNKRVNITIAASGAGSLIWTNGEPGALAMGDLVYVSAPNTVSRSDATNLAKMPAIGIAVSVSPTEVETATAFKLSGYSGLTVGDLRYVGSLGALSTTPPGSGMVQLIGMAVSTTEILCMVIPWRGPYLV